MSPVGLEMFSNSPVCCEIIPPSTLLLQGATISNSGGMQRIESFWQLRTKENSTVKFANISDNYFCVRSFLVFPRESGRVVTTNQVLCSQGAEDIQWREIFKILVVISYSRNVTDLLTLILLSPTGAIYTIACQYRLVQLFEVLYTYVCKETTLCGHPF